MIEHMQLGDMPKFCESVKDKNGFLVSRKNMKREQA